MSGATTTTLRVRYAETDQQAVVYHAHYFVWMEMGRTEFLEELGFPYRRLEEAGVFFSVVSAACRYAGAAGYADRVEVTTRLAELHSRTLRFHYEVRVESRPVATGETTLICLDAERRPRRIPEPLASALATRLEQR